MTAIKSQSAPHALEAERALLASIMLDNAALYQALNQLTASDFFGDGHQIIFPAMCRLSGAGNVINLVTLSEELERGEALKKAGGASYLVALQSSLPLGADALADYVSIIKEKSVIRSLLNASQNLSARCLLGAEHSAALLESAYSQLFDVAARNLGGLGGPQPISEIIAQLIPRLQKTTGQGIQLGIDSGYETYNALTGGWQAGELVVLAARPSMGKSALALDFLRKLAERGEPVCMFNLEMSKDSLVLRLACRISKVDSLRLRFGKLDREEFNSLLNAINEINRWPIFIDDSPGLSIEQIQWRIKSIAQQHKIKLCVVDHIQLVRANAENRTQEVTRISGGLQQSARELGSISGGTLMALSQLSRVGAEEEPQNHHLRESGSIEQDADVIIFLWDKLQNTEEQIKASGCRAISLKIGKQRNGPTGTSPMLFFPARVGFEEEDWRSKSEMGRAD